MYVYVCMYFLCICVYVYVRVRDTHIFCIGSEGRISSFLSIFFHFQVRLVLDIIS